jgi:AAA domain
MRLDLRPPASGPPRIVETDQMCRAANLTLGIVRDGGLAVWTGHSRVGKSTTARRLTARMNEEPDAPDQRQFRALHYETGEIRENGGNPQRQAIRSLYYQVVGEDLMDHAYRRMPTESIVEQIVRSATRKNLRALFIDEAGCLCVGAIAGMILVYDIAENLGWPITMVFIGMDDLATKMEEKPQIKGRIREWCYFEEYNFDQTKDLLRGLHDHFPAKSKWSQALEEESEFIWEQCGGFPGEILKFLHQVDDRLADLHREIDLKVLKTVRQLVVQDHDNAVADVKAGHVRRAQRSNAKPTARVT